jgi:hypothetical protein
VVEPEDELGLPDDEDDAEAVAVPSFDAAVVVAAPLVPLSLLDPVADAPSALVVEPLSAPDDEAAEDESSVGVKLTVVPLGY